MMGKELDSKDKGPGGRGGDEGWTAEGGNKIKTTV